MTGMTEEERLKADVIRAARALIDHANCSAICVHMPDSDQVVLAGPVNDLPALLERAQEDDQ
ncbi:hypothetical protein E7V67_011365 [[Empedobacter] haloabium]|uniref:BON domain-containing protein n=1 Tax=[Empedobacter] haloabium TaxID=592317 RepID=A0ABZ1USK4_9BURK